MKHELRWIALLGCMWPTCLSLGRTSSTSKAISPRLTQIQLEPCDIVFEDVSMAYPKKWPDNWLRLFSSLPRREYALYNVSFTWSPGSIILLTGDSSSGKSTIFKLISGREVISTGTMRLFRRCSSSSSSSRPLSSTAIPNEAVTPPRPPARPIYLEDRPPRDDGRTLHQLLREACEQHNMFDPIWQRSMSLYFLRMVGLLGPVSGLSGDDQPAIDAWSHLSQQRHTQLSPSESYQFQLALASLRSTLSGVSNNLEWGGADVSSTLLLPAPILLLDEWLDREPTSIVSKVVHKAQSR